MSVLNETLWILLEIDYKSCTPDTAALKLVRFLKTSNNKKNRGKFLQQLQ